MPFSRCDDSEKTQKRRGRTLGWAEGWVRDRPETDIVLGAFLRTLWRN